MKSTMKRRHAFVVSISFKEEVTAKEARKLFDGLNKSSILVVRPPTPRGIPGSIDVAKITISQVGEQ